MRYANVAGVQRHVRGWKPDLPDHRDKMFKAPALTLGTVVDLRPKCPPVRDQLQWGSCTSNACAEAMGFLHQRAGNLDPTFSRFFIYYFTRLSQGDEPTEDSGAYIRETFKVLARMGACLESTWPYTSKNFSSEPTPITVAEAKENQALLYYRCTSLQTIKASLAQGFPVVFGFSTPENLTSEECARTGIVKFPGPTEGITGGHAVLAVGYDDLKLRIIFQNSWGRDWGDDGFGYLPYRFFAEDLADDFWTLRRQETP